jgi:hypothetical protein
VSVLSPVDRPNHVIGYFTLSNSSVDRGTVSNKFAKHARHRSIPATLVGMLARDGSQSGMLEHLLRAAFERAVQADQVSASRLLVIDAATEDLATLYESYGFSRAKQIEGASTIRLIYLMQDLILALERRDQPEVEPGG